MRKVGITRRTTLGHSQLLIPNTAPLPSCPTKVRVTEKSPGAPSNRSASHWMPPQLGKALSANTTSSCRGLLAKHPPRRTNCTRRGDTTERSSLATVSGEIIKMRKKNQIRVLILCFQFKGKKLKGPVYQRARCANKSYRDRSASGCFLRRESARR